VAAGVLTFSPPMPYGRSAMLFWRASAVFRDTGHSARWRAVMPALHASGVSKCTFVQLVGAGHPEMGTPCWFSTLKCFATAHMHGLPVVGPSVSSGVVVAGGGAFLYLAVGLATPLKRPPASKKPTCGRLVCCSWAPVSSDRCEPYHEIYCVRLE
jgi:hypothetical protein